MIALVILSCSQDFPHPRFLVDIGVQLRRPLPEAFAACNLVFDKRRERDARCADDRASDPEVPPQEQAADCAQVDVSCPLPGESRGRWGILLMSPGPPVVPWAGISHVQPALDWPTVLANAKSTWGRPDAVVEMDCIDGMLDMGVTQHYPGIFANYFCGGSSVGMQGRGVERIAMWEQESMRAWVQHFDVTNAWVTTFADYGDTPPPPIGSL